jgi:hypothetical protein
MAAASGESGTVVVSVAEIAAEASASGALTAWLSWFSPTCRPLLVELAQGPGAMVGARPEVVVLGSDAYVALADADLTMRVAHVQLDIERCALDEREPVRSIRAMTSSLALFGDGPRLVAHRDAKAVAIDQLALAPSRPAFFAPDHLRPRAVLAGSAAVAAWLEGDNVGGRLRIGVADAKGVVSPVVAFTGRHVPERLAMAGGVRDAVVAWTELDELRVETVVCKVGE